MRKTWAAAGLGAGRVRVDAAAPTSTACLPVYKRDGKRAVYCAQGGNASFAPDADLAAYDVVTLGYPHVMPALRGAPLAAFAKRAAAAGCCLALDVDLPSGIEICPSVLAVAMSFEKTTQAVQRCENHPKSSLSLRVWSRPQVRGRGTL